MQLQGKTALVTGGAVRIGRHLSRRLAAAGANVCLHYNSSSEAVPEAVRELEAFGVGVTAIQADFIDPHRAAVEVFRRAAADASVDVLINNASIFEPGALVDADPEQWRRHMAINLEAPLWLSREFAGRLPDEREGQIVNILDWRALRPVPGHLAYTVSKAGLLAMTKLLARELAPRIRVNAVAPGAILVPSGEDESTAESLKQRNPLLRLGGESAVGDAVMYLLASEFVTGAVVPVTGGEEL